MPTWPDPLTHLLDEERRLLFQGDRYYDSTRYLTLVYLPAPDVANRVARWFYEGGRCGLELVPAMRSRTSPRHAMTSPICSPACLKEIRMLSDDETCTYLHACVSPKTHPRECARGAHVFSTACSTDTPLTGGFAPKLGDYHVQVLSIGGFPNTSTPGIVGYPKSLGF